MATKVIESEGDATLSRSEVGLITRLDNAMTKLDEKQEEFAAYLKELKQRQDEVDELKKHILEAMDESGVKKLENDRLLITAVHPKPTKRISAKELQARAPELFAQAFEIAGTETETSGYVKITVKSNLLK